LPKTPDVSKIKAIFFDLDGTLTDYEASVDYAMTRLWEMLKGDCPLCLDAFLRAQWEFMAEMEDKEARGEVPRSFLKDRRTRNEEFLNRIGPRLIEHFDDVGELYTRYREEGVALYPSTSDVLGELSRRFALGVITEGDGPNQRMQLEKAGIARFFAHLVISDELRLHKPDAALFRKACEMARVQPQQAALVGDRIDWDIAPAKGIGMLTVLSRQQKHYRVNQTFDVRPDFAITGVKQLLEIFCS